MRETSLRFMRDEHVRRSEMATHLKRARLRPGRAVGCMRSIPRERARDDDLQFFLRMSKLSLEACRAYLDGLISAA
jgi:hypothetical protein